MNNFLVCFVVFVRLVTYLYNFIYGPRLSGKLMDSMFLVNFNMIFRSKCVMFFHLHKTEMAPVKVIHSLDFF